MIDSFTITMVEWNLLAGAPWIARLLYLYLLPRRDFRTGVVGAHTPLISWEALAQDLTVESYPGILRDKPSHNRVRRACGWLVRFGLVEMRSNMHQRHLIFFLPLASRKIFVSKKAGSKPTDQADRPLQRENMGKADRPQMAKADTHRASVSNYRTTGLADHASIPEPVDKHIVWASVTPTEKAKINEAIQRSHVPEPTAVAMLDELARAIDKGAIRTTRVGYVVGCIVKWTNGAFNRDRAARAPTAASQRPRTPPPGGGDAPASPAVARGHLAAARATMKGRAP